VCVCVCVRACGWVHAGSLAVDKGEKAVLVVIGGWVSAGSLAVDKGEKAVLVVIGPPSMLSKAVGDFNLWGAGAMLGSSGRRAKGATGRRAAGAGAGDGGAILEEGEGEREETGGVG
jgi:hypothetical protein